MSSCDKGYVGTKGFLHKRFSISSKHLHVVYRNKNKLRVVPSKAGSHYARTTCRASAFRLKIRVTHLFPAVKKEGRADIAEAEGEGGKIEMSTKEAKTYENTEERNNNFQGFRKRRRLSSTTLFLPAPAAFACSPTLSSTRLPPR